MAGPTSQSSHSGHVPKACRGMLKFETWMGGGGGWDLEVGIEVGEGGGKGEGKGKGKGEGKGKGRRRGERGASAGQKAAGYALNGIGPAAIWGWLALGQGAATRRARTQRRGAWVPTRPAEAALLQQAAWPQPKLNQGGAAGCIQNGMPRREGAYDMKLTQQTLEKEDSALALHRLRVVMLLVAYGSRKEASMHDTLVLTYRANQSTCARGLEPAGTQPHSISLLPLSTATETEAKVVVPSIPVAAGSTKPRARPASLESSAGLLSFCVVA
ncbi:hypothetical protein BDZ91DRAFT_780609 [Kalaharituber pfeilii]|nr:hypothetical protein BDZ91DRAFT_780609 [Kalaharituber pfeilii]